MKLVSSLAYLRFAKICYIKILHVKSALRVFSGTQFTVGCLRDQPTEAMVGGSCVTVAVEGTCWAQQELTKREGPVWTTPTIQDHLAPSGGKGTLLPVKEAGASADARADLAQGKRRRQLERKVFMNVGCRKSSGALSQSSNDFSARNLESKGKSV